MLKNLKARKARLLKEIDTLKGDDPQLENDETRAAVEKKTADLEALNEQIREAEAAESAPVTETRSAEQIAKDAVEAERKRGADIRGIVTRAKLPAAFADELVSSGATVEQARAKVLDKLADEQEANPTRQAGGGVQFGEDAQDKALRGMTNWLLTRSGMLDLVAKHEGLKASEMSPGEFRGLTLIDLAKESLTRRGISFRGKDRMEIAGLAMRGNYQTTSDFATLLENTMHKILRAAYGLQTDTWSRWCGTATVSDFRSHNWYRLGSLTALDSLAENGEFKNKAIPDAEKASYSVATKGNIIAITRQTIVNDDLGGMTRLTGQLGRAGKLTIESAVYSKLGENSGLGPTQSNSQPLFHSSRSNVNATGSALSVAGLDADRVVLGQQLDPNGVDYIDLVPDVLLVPIGLGGSAKVINNSEFDHDSTKLRQPNKVRGLFRDVIDTPRLSGTRRYLFADRNTAPVFLVSFLEGQQEPVLETQDGWRTDGVELKARLDFGVDVVDYRGAVTNAGA